MDLGKKYEQDFDPIKYHDTYYRILDDEVKFWLTEYYNAFTDLIGKGSNDLRILDYGCGPNPIYAAAAVAASCTNSITMADKCMQNRSEINKWMNGSEESLDWEIYFNYLGTLSNKSSTEIQCGLREAFEEVLPCDVNQTDSAVSELKGSYNILMTTLCLEFATSSIPELRASLCHLKSLIAPGGLLLWGGALVCNLYHLGESVFPSVMLAENNLRDVFEDQHLELKLVSLKTLDRTTSVEERPADHVGVFFLIAKRI